MSRMHLLGFLMHTPINHMTLSWAHPDDTRIEDMRSFASWQALARTLEHFCFDGLFFADIPAPYDIFEGRTDAAVRYGVCWPSHDPVALLGPMAAATERLGFAATLSVAGIPPFSAVRTLSSLDYLSGGRIGWNVVTGNARSEHLALGIEPLEHDERYERAEEYMEICYALWRGIDPDALISDKAAGLFADPARVRKVAFEGARLKCSATPSVLPSPQGRPVLFQAGSSGRGQQFAAKHADVVFGIQPNARSMKALVDSTRAGMAAAGRAGGGVLFAVQPFMGGTEEEARKLRDHLIERIPLEAALTRLSGTLGVDFSQYDLDSPLEELPTQASRGMMAAVAGLAKERKWTIREAVRTTGTLGSTPQLVGTPEQIADELITLWTESGCLGFNVTPPISPKSLVDFAEQVVPILQRRGVFRQYYEGRTFRDNLLVH